jgi:glutamine synthetase
MGTECEFTVFRPAPDGPVPAHAGPAYGLGPLLDLEDFVTDAVQELERVGVGVEQFHPEYGPGQMEVSLSPAVPVTAIDQYLLTRIMLRRTARRHGLQVSHAPVTVADPGAARARPLGRRLRLLGPGEPGSRPPVRPGHRHEPRSSANCELKSVDASANPYLVAAAIIALSQHGVTARQPLPDPVSAAPDDLPAGVRERAGIHRLPADLGTALGNLQQSRLPRDALGDALIDTFVAVRRHELSTYAARPLSEVVPLMRWAY